MSSGVASRNRGSARDVERDLEIIRGDVGAVRLRVEDCVLRDYLAVAAVGVQPYARRPSRWSHAEPLRPYWNCVSTWVALSPVMSGRA